MVVLSRSYFCLEIILTSAQIKHFGFFCRNDVVIMGYYDPLLILQLGIY